MSQYNMFQAIVMSFYSKALYRDVAINWGGKVFIYLLLIQVLAWIGSTYMAQVGINQLYAKYSTQLVAQTPVMTFKDGKVSTPEKKPYIITLPDNERFAVIDTTGHYKTPAQAEASLLITETEFISSDKPGETKIHAIPKDLEAVFDPQLVNKVIQKFISFT